MKMTPNESNAVLQQRCKLYVCCDPMQCRGRKDVLQSPVVVHHVGDRKPLQGMHLPDD